MIDLILHPLTKRLIDGFINKPSHGLNLIGEAGGGRRSLAFDIAGKILSINPDALEGHAYFKVVEPIDGNISIESIRAIQEFLKLKTPGKGSIRRVIYIDQADFLSLEAQNALLKMLEEPPADTLFILSTVSPHSLRSTVHSRIMPISVQPPAKKQIMDYFVSKGHDAKAIEKNYLISGGQVGIMCGLFERGQNHPLIEQIAQAKIILASDYYDRLTLVESLAKDKDNLRLFLSAVHKIVFASLKNKSSKNNQRELKRLVNMLKSTQSAIDSLDHNSMTKLTLTNFMLQL